MNELFRPIFEGALAGEPCRWPLDADAPHEFILIDDAAEAMLKLINTPAAHGRPVHVPGPNPTTARKFIRLVYAAAGSREPTIRVIGRGAFWFAGRSEEHTSELQSRGQPVRRHLLEKTTGQAIP